MLRGARSKGAGICAAIVAAALVAASPAGSAAQQCQGEPVTGDRGTAGDDVLVIRDGASVDTGQGDDLVCMIGPGGFHEVYAGAGNDQIFGGEGQDYI